MRQPLELTVRPRQTRSLSELSSDEVVATIEADLRRAYPPQGAAISESDGPDAIWRVTGIPDKYFNNVTYASWRSAEAADHVGDMIDELDGHGVDYSWWIGPSSSPAELPELLEELGMVYQEDFPGMAIDLRTLPDEVSAVGGLEMRALLASPTPSPSRPTPTLRLSPDFSACSLRRATESPTIGATIRGRSTGRLSQPRRPSPEPV